MHRPPILETSAACRIERTFFALVLALALGTGAAAVARADGGSSAPSMPSNPPPSAQPPALSAEEKAAIAKKKAEDTYAAAYRDVEKAQAELAEAGTLRAAGDEKSVKKADEREKSAAKKLAKSAGRFREVVAVLPEHAHAWNMLGYSLRMTGDLDGAFDAYWKALAIDPEHAGAREYLGEAYLRSGRIEQARGELAWLEKKGAKEAATLAAAIAAWEKANPEAAAKASVTPPVPETK